jgi:hypothetical protein
MRNNANNFLIKFAFQHWNEQYDWWHPNTVPLDFVIEDQRRPPSTHQYHWFDHNLYGVTTNYESIDLFNFSARQTDYLCNYRNVRYFKLDDVKNTKYIFPVMIHAFGYFMNHETIGFNFVSSQVLTDVKNGNAKIVFIFPLEGRCGQKTPQHEREFEILNAWCLANKLSKEHVYFIHGNFSVDDTVKNFNFTYIPVQGFHCWLKTKMDDIVDYKPDATKNLFLTYNRRCDWHRLLLVCQLMKNNLLDRGLVSFSGKTYYTDKTLDDLITDAGELADIGHRLTQILPLELDTPLEFNNPVNEIIKEHHSSTLLNVITETMFEPGTIFYSEKTWKPILAGQAFMFVGTQGQLAELKRQGYKSFDQWFCEDYDSEPDIQVRVKMIVEELVKLSKLSADQLINMRKEMEPTLRHNQSLFLNQRNAVYKNQNEEYLYLEIKKIWDTF